MDESDLSSPNTQSHMTADDSNGSRGPTSPRVAHTLTACTRCRQRKQRCDTGLPRCGPCERTNSHCEYFDQTKGVKIPRHYVVHLQHKVTELEAQLEALENESYEPDPESIVRDGASVKIQGHEESKFLGPSSGIAITRLVMHLAKRFTQSASISDIVDQEKAEEVAKIFEEEEKKTTSKVYPHISDVAAPELPERGLTNVLVRLFNVKVMAMYPFFHEATFWQDVDDVYNGSQDSFQNFALRMVIAISLQRTSTEYAGLADSFYLAALKYLEDAVRPMNIETIQCFILIGAYSLLTPTRTAVYYVIGLATRLTQALGLCDEQTISLGSNGESANPLEVDMRRRVFWCVMVMEYGLAHSMGRASSFAMALDHINVNWFEVVDDQYITNKGVDPGAPRSLKKWISIHFFKMRLLQLEIRRTLYQVKRPTPKDHNDPWFKEMEEKLIAWRDVTPDTDAGSGLDKAWFIGRYNTMIVFLFRPSPQCPTPSLEAAQRCFPACVWNIAMHRSQIDRGNVDMTWIFTQAMFMTINTILWTLSFEQIRRENPRDDVQRHLNVALECIKIASERWPGVISALELYKSLIAACMRIYDQTGNVEISAASPSEISNSQATSPNAQFTPPYMPPNARVSAPDIKLTRPGSSTTFVSMDQMAHTNPDNSYFNGYDAAHHQRSTSHTTIRSSGADEAISGATTLNQVALPSTFPDLVTWNPEFDFTTVAPSFSVPALSPYETGPATAFSTNGSFPELASPSHVPWTDYLYPPSYEIDRSSSGLNEQEQCQLMESLQTTGVGMIQHMIDATNAVFYPRNGQN